jgi:hypothetical protein
MIAVDKSADSASAATRAHQLANAEGDVTPRTSDAVP